MPVGQGQRQLFVCVYRRWIPPPSVLVATETNAATNPLLGRFLAEYWRDDRFLDWGDDPAFFSALEAFGDARRASWAVCRPDVRADLAIGDVVAFVVGKPGFEVSDRDTRKPRSDRSVDYYYIGCGTVDRLIWRDELWRDQSLATYRTFFNALARPPQGEEEVWINVEQFRPIHADWLTRAQKAPVVLFDPARSFFELENPPLIARYEDAPGPPERWVENPTARRLKQLLLGQAQRGLRTSRTGYQHARFRATGPAQDIDARRDALVEIAEHQRRTGSVLAR